MGIVKNLFSDSGFNSGYIYDSFSTLKDEISGEMKRLITQK